MRYFFLSLIFVLITCQNNNSNNDEETSLFALAALQPQQSQAKQTQYGSLPANVIMKSIAQATFTMGNNNLTGPQAGTATEHSVTLSTFQMSETEITNTQYVEFLNAALTSGLITVTTGTVPPDKGNKLIVGTSISTYEGKVLYNLSGTRVMKDHDDGDGDSNYFTGSIEPENPINIAFIGYNESTNKFYVKDPFSASDFHWYNLCNYYDYTSTTNELSTTLKNDFSNWSELNNWTESNPSLVTSLPTQTEVGEYPVTFIRWWGAKAYALYYGVKLPSEAQWEYAAKGGSNFTYAVYDGVTTSDANWNSQKLTVATHHVRKAKSGNANPFGLYNLGGNVWEWMEDNFVSFTSSSASDPVLYDGSTKRSWRGGSWNYHEATMETSGRYYDKETVGNDHFGFRIVK